VLQTLRPMNVEITGRKTSHFTRVAAIFAHELGVPFELVSVKDLWTLESTTYGGNPALKIPSVRIGTSVVFGTENVCRKLVEHAGRAGDARIVFPEHATSDAARCAQELTWHAMSAQVTLILGTMLSKLPPDDIFFRKARTGLEGALTWLDANLGRVLDELPRPRDLSVFEVSLFCLVEHLAFRPTLPEGAPPGLRQFAAGFGTRPSAERTPYVLSR
jgi:glutathione S-transferase